MAYCPEMTNVTRLSRYNRAHMTLTSTYATSGYMCGFDLFWRHRCFNRLVYLIRDNKTISLDLVTISLRFPGVLEGFSVNYYARSLAVSVHMITSLSIISLPLSMPLCLYANSGLTGTVTDDPYPQIWVCRARLATGMLCAQRFNTLVLEVGESNVNS
jgi:hypothetical protein